MFILREEAVGRDLSALDRAWSGQESFVFAPRKSGVGDEWLDEARAALPEHVRTGHFGLLTSGSTGQPKLIVGSRARAEALAKLLHQLQDGEPVERAICLLPISYSYAFVNQWLWARVCDRELVPTAGFSDPPALREVLRHARAAQVCMVAGQLRLLAQHCSSEAFPGVIRLHFAGGPFPFDRLDAIREVFPNAAVFNNYGCAEAMPRLTVTPAHRCRSSRDIGSPLPGVEMRVGESDALLFRSAFGAVGWVDAAGYHAVEPDTWVPTGDLAVESEGRFELLGRSGEVFKRFGEKISVALLRSTVLATWRGDAAFYRQRDRSGEEGCVLVLSPEPGAPELRAVLAAFRQHHRRPHWPLRIESVPRIPLLPNGKPDLTSLQNGTERSIHWDQRT